MKSALLAFAQPRSMIVALKMSLGQMTTFAQSHKKSLIVKQKLQPRRRPLTKPTTWADSLMVLRQIVRL